MPAQQLLPALRQVTCATLALILPSCALPPREVWNSIRQEGLITYYLKGGPSPVQQGSGRPLTTYSPEPMLAASSTANQPTPPEQAAVGSSTRSGPTAGPRRIDASPAPAVARIPTAEPVLDLPGYVRSPYTNPPRMVDVRGLKAGDRAVCPFTRKSFLVPAQAVAVTPQVAAHQAPKSTPPAAPRLSPPVVVPESAKPRTDVAAMTRPTPEPKLETPAPIKPAATPASNIPYGTAIAGRPGFVNSPYAAKHQLVDVTGLPAGMEVKCPYTGKLFRVPPQ